MKKYGLILILFIAITMLTTAQTATRTLAPTRTITQPPATTSTRTPTERPWMTGDLYWSRDINVYSFLGDVVFPVTNASVTASGLTSITVTTDSNGKCSLQIIAHDTGSVTITVVKSGMATYSQVYPGLPGTGTLTIYMNEPTGPAGLSLLPATQTVNTGASFSTTIQVTTGGQIIAAYGFDLNWTAPVISVDTSIGLSGVEAGPDGYVSAVNSTTPGMLVISGFDNIGKGPGVNLHFLTIHWLAGSAAGSTALALTVDTLTDPVYNSLGVSLIANATITVTGQLMGDVNSDGAVTIVDALMVAQYAVGLSVPQFNTAAADVNKDGSITIIDALMIAQYTVGLITSL